MKTIKIGNKNVPIIGHQDRPGNPGSGDVANNVIASLGLSNGQMWEMGVSVGSTEAFTSNSGIQTNSVSISMTGGRTSLHDACELVADTPELTDTTSAYPGYKEKLIIVHQDGQTSEQLRDCGYVRIARGTSGSGQLNFSRNDYIRLVGISYSYPDSSAPSTKVKSYVILAITMDYTKNYTTGNEQITYAREGYWYLNLAYLNSSKSLYMYVDEEDAPEEEDPNNEDDPSDEDGGDGDHTPIYDPIPIPNAPTLGAANAGFITMYKLGLAAINTFASDMFASTVWEAIRLFFSNPIDFLVGCMLLPFEPETGSSYHPKFGIVSFEHAYPAVSNQYKDIDCGSININKYWGSCFDYEPYTKIQIWLPYIGYRELPVDEIMGMTVSVKYRCDCLTGDCVAFVYTGVVGQTGPQVERVIGQFYGNCGIRVPFGSVSYDSAVASSIQLIGAAATTGLSAGAGAMSQTGGAVGGLMAGADAVMTDGNVRSASIGVVQGLKPNVHKGGAAGASTGYMSIQKPYIIKRIPRQNLPSNYMGLKGYPSNIGGKLADFTGLAVVDDIQLNDIPAMEDERKEIIKWLRGGVLI